MSEIKNYGDITKINGFEIEITDVVIGGSPCQDLSVAGKRAGLAGERSGLFMEQIRLIKEMREHDKQRADRRADEPVRPRYMVFENVCGAFSSNNGEDFRCVLEETAKVADENASVPRLAKGQKWPSAGCIMGDGYSLAWRVHDAQYWGVPQRRKRICLLADFNGHSAPKILFELVGETEHPEAFEAIGNLGNESRPEVQFEPEGLSGDFETCGEAGQEVAGASAKGVGTTSVNGNGIAVGADVYNGDVTGETAATLTSASGDTNTSGPKVVYGISSFDSNAMKSPNPNSGIYEAETSRTLDNNGGNPACNQGGVAVVETFDVRITSENTQNSRAHCYKTEISRSLDTVGDNPKGNQGGVAVVYCGDSITCPTNASNPKPNDPCHTLTNDERNYVVCIEGNGTRDSHRGDGYKESETMYTLNTVEQHGVCVGVESYNLNTTGEVSKTIASSRSDSEHIPVVAYGLDRASFNQGKNAQFDISVEKELAPRL